MESLKHQCKLHLSLLYAFHRKGKNVPEITSFITGNGGEALFFMDFLMFLTNHY